MEIQNRIFSTATMERQLVKSHLRSQFLSFHGKYPPSSSSINAYSQVSSKALKHPALFKHPDQHSLSTKRENLLNLSYRSRHPKMSTAAVSPSSPKRARAGGEDDPAAKKQKIRD